MKILFSSYAFQPSVGGIESVSRILAENFSAEGHDVELTIAREVEQLRPVARHREQRRHGSKNSRESV